MTPANNDGQDYYLILYGYGTLSSFSNPKTVDQDAQPAALANGVVCGGTAGRGSKKKRFSFAGGDRAGGVVSRPLVFRSPAFISLTFRPRLFQLLPRPGRVCASCRPASGRSSVTALAALALRFLHQSIIAGVDVAWRALDPRMPLRPGLVTYDVRLPPGPARSAFLTLMSLLPGSLPAWQEDDGRITIHCLDVGQPVAAQMAEEEKLFIRALGVDPNND